MNAQNSKPEPSDFAIALNALLNAVMAIRQTPNIKNCTMDHDHHSAEVIFDAGDTAYILRLQEKTND